MSHLDISPMVLYVHPKTITHNCCFYIENTLYVRGLLLVAPLKFYNNPGPWSNNRYPMGHWMRAYDKNFLWNIIYLASSAENESKKFIAY
jgi:hypothetical protein